MDNDNRSLHETVHPFYVIYSRWSLRSIEDFLTSHSAASDKACMRVDYKLEETGMTDTNRTFILMKESLVKGLKDNKYHLPGRKGFFFSKFKIRDDFKIDHRSLCIPIPVNLGLTGSEIKNYIETRMLPFIEFGVVTPTDYTVIVPMLSREADTPKKACYINFEKGVSNDSMIVVRTLLNYTKWETSVNDCNLMCFFSNSMPQKVSKKKKIFYRPTDNANVESVKLHEVIEAGQL